MWPSLLLCQNTKEEIYLHTKTWADWIFYFLPIHNAELQDFGLVIAISS